MADVVDLCRHVVRTPGVELAGLGTNLACQSGVAPDQLKMDELSQLVEKVESACDLDLTIISGGNSANLDWALSTADAGPHQRPAPRRGHPARHRTTAPTRARRPPYRCVHPGRRGDRGEDEARAAVGRHRPGGLRHSAGSPRRRARPSGHRRPRPPGHRPRRTHSAGRHHRAGHEQRPPRARRRATTTSPSATSSRSVSATAPCCVLRHHPSSRTARSARRYRENDDLRSNLLGDGATRLLRIAPVASVMNRPKISQPSTVMPATVDRCACRVAAAPQAAKSSVVDAVPGERPRGCRGRRAPTSPVRRPIGKQVEQLGHDLASGQARSGDRLDHGGDHGHQRPRPASARARRPWCRSGGAHAGWPAGAGVDLGTGSSPGPAVTAEACAPIGLRDL